MITWTSKINIIRHWNCRDIWITNKGLRLVLKQLVYFAVLLLSWCCRCCCSTCICCYMFDYKLLEEERSQSSMIVPTMSSLFYKTGIFQSTIIIDLYNIKNVSIHLKLTASKGICLYRNISVKLLNLIQSPSKIAYKTSQSHTYLKYITQR